MRKSYIFIYSESLGSREEVKKGLDSIGIILDWRYELPNCFFLISEFNSADIVAEIRRVFGNKLFLITEFSENSQGWLSKESWHLLNNKYRKT